MLAPMEQEAQMGGGGGQLLGGHVADDAAVRACEARLRALLRRSRRPTSARRSAPTSEVDARLTRRTARRDSATAAESRRRCGHNGYSDGAP